MSKNFKPEEVLGYIDLNGRKYTYLKMGVRRNPKYNDYFQDEELEQINVSLFYQNWQSLFQIQQREYNIDNI